MPCLAFEEASLPLAANLLDHPISESLISLAFLTSAIFAGHRHQSNFGREYQRGVIERGRDKEERERPIYPVSSISITFSVTMAVTTESQQQEQQQSTGFSSFSSFFTSLLPSARADEPQEEEDKSDDNAGGDDSGDAEETEAGGDDEEEEEEEEEPEDVSGVLPRVLADIHYANERHCYYPAPNACLFSRSLPTDLP